MDIRSNIDSTQFRWAVALYLPRWAVHVYPDDIQMASIRIMAQKLELVQKCLGAPLLVHCWLRPPVYNDMVKGSPTSAHLVGGAVDFSCQGGAISVDRIKQILEPKLEEFSIRMEDNRGCDWIHVDIKKPISGRFFKP